MVCPAEERKAHMNAITLFLMLVLQGNLTCAAETPNQTTLATTKGSQLVQIQIYACYWRAEEVASHHFMVVSPICPNYVGQPILVEEVKERKGWVMNRFGEFYPASVNIDMMDVYNPTCN
jgi:hypothetical protein